MSQEPSATSEASPAPTGLLSLFLVFLRLGLTSFGGPVAHLGYFREAFVARRGWLKDSDYADLVALCQFLPGPASSQVGLGVGLLRGGYAGAALAWIGFTLPSALLMALFGLGVTFWGDVLTAGVLQGLKVVAVAVVAQAVWGMAVKLCPDRQRISLMALATLAVLAWPTPLMQVLVILAGAGFGLVVFRGEAAEAAEGLTPKVSRPVALIALGLFFALLLGLPLLSALVSSQSLALIDSFYRSGSLVFGGGHVVLPLLQSEVVPPGWVGEDAFLAGYGAAQAVPGPLFTFSAYLGAVLSPAPNGLLGAALCLVAIFAPSFLLVIGVLPFWSHLRRYARMQAALKGINAAVVGLLLAACYNPVWTSAIHAPTDFSLALLAFIVLVFWQLPPWLVVVVAGLVGGLLL